MRIMTMGGVAGLLACGLACGGDPNPVELCQSQFHDCCTRSSQCREALEDRPICIGVSDRSAGTCVECVNDSQCGTDERCSSNNECVLDLIDCQNAGPAPMAWLLLAGLLARLARRRRKAPTS